MKEKLQELYIQLKFLGLEKFANLLDFEKKILISPSELDDENLVRLKKYIDEADAHPEFEGYNLVKGEAYDINRKAILDDKGVVVGFMTPRIDGGFWRTGAIYIDSNMRGFGFAKRAIVKFFQDSNHRPAKVWISDLNFESQRAFEGAGFKKGNRRDIGNSDNDKGFDYYLF